MADIEKVAQGAKDVTKRVKSSDALSKPVGLAVAGAALAALPFAVPEADRRRAETGREGRGRHRQAPRRRSSPRSPTLRKTPCPTHRANFIGGNPLKKVFGGGDSRRRRRRRLGGARRAGLRQRSADAIQQSVDVAVPVKAVYNHWTEFENSPSSCTGSRARSRSMDRPSPSRRRSGGSRSASRPRSWSSAPTSGSNGTSPMVTRIPVSSPSTRCRRSDQDRPLAGHPAREPDRQGESRDALRQARRPR